MKNNKLLIIFLGVLFILVLGYLLNKGSFNAPSSIQNNKKLKVTTSFYPLYFFSAQIGGDKAEVLNITPAGSEPHDYDPTTQDIARLEGSNMLVLNGSVETWGNKIKDNLAGTKVKIIIAGEGLFTQKLNEAGKTNLDPHIWLSPKLAKKEVKNITQGFIAIDLENKSYYEANEKTLDGKLDNLDNDYKQGLSNCQQKDIITSHAAFGYLAAAYGLNQVPIAGLSPDTEPSAQQLVKVAQFAKGKNVRYIFFESLVSPKLSETIANEIGAKTLVLDPLEGLSDDSIKQGKNYFTIMEDNLKNLQEALECTK